MTQRDVPAGAPTVGWIGLGAMGYPMAGRTAARFRTLVWNRTASVADRHAGEYGSEPVPLERAVAADVVLSCLSNTAAVADVVEAGTVALAAGTTWVDCTSGAPEASRELARRLAGLGVAYLDAPVSGMVRGARAGSLTMLVGGEEAALDRVRPVLGTMADTIVHVGPVGTGHLAKAANNSLFAVSFWAVAEALGGLAAAGVPLTAALEAVNASSGRSYVTERFVADCVLADPPAPGYRLGQSAVDVGLLVNALAAAGIERPKLLAAVAAWYGELAARVGEDAGAARAFESIAPEGVSPEDRR